MLTNHLLFHLGIVPARGILSALREGDEAGGLQARQRCLAALPHRHSRPLPLRRRSRRLHQQRETVITLNPAFCHQQRLVCLVTTIRLTALPGHAAA